MGFVVGTTIIIWLLVAITAFEARSAQPVDDAVKKSRKRSINDEK